jgi:hypothetical protein
LHPIPDLSQVQVIVGRQVITGDKWPAGKIEAVPVTFPVAWRIEMPQESSGILEVTQDKMSPMITATEAWFQMHSLVPRLYEDANLDFRGELKPGLVISAEIIRVNVRSAVEFVVIRTGAICYIHEVIRNMVTWAEIHAHFSSFDKRIPPFECYLNDENRPYYSETKLSFRLAKGVEIPYTTREFGGAAGGVSQGGFLLPPITFPVTVDVPEWKIQGGSPGQVRTNTDSSSDRMDDKEDDDTHKLHRLSQAVAKGQKIVVEIRGYYQWERQIHEVIFGKEFKIRAPENTMITTSLQMDNGSVNPGTD